MKNLSVILLCGLLSGCTTMTNTRSDAATDATDASLPQCSYDFTATIRSGPSAGTEVRGSLAMVQSGTTVNSILVPMGSADRNTTTSVAVPTTASNGNITLTIPQGSANIVGTGAFSGFSPCPSQLAGTLTGPMSGDTGDWLGTIQFSSGLGCTFYVLYCKSSCPSCSTGNCAENCRAGGVCD